MFGLKKIVGYEWKYEVKWGARDNEDVPELGRIFFGHEDTLTECKKAAYSHKDNRDMEIGGVKFTRGMTIFSPKAIYVPCGPIEYLRNKRAVAEDEGLSRNYDSNGEFAYLSGFRDAEEYLRERYLIIIYWLSCFIIGFVTTGVLTKLQIL